MGFDATAGFEIITGAIAPMDNWLRSGRLRSRAGVGVRSDRLRLGGGDGALTRAALPGVGQDEVLLDVHVADRDVGGLEDLVVEAGDDSILARGERQLVAAGIPGLGRADLSSLKVDGVDLNSALPFTRLVEVGAAIVVVGDTHQLGLVSWPGWRNPG